MAELDQDFEAAAHYAAAHTPSMFKGDAALTFALFVASRWQAVAHLAEQQGKTKMETWTQASRPGSLGCVAMGGFSHHLYALDRASCLEYGRTLKSDPSFVLDHQAIWE